MQSGESADLRFDYWIEQNFTGAYWAYLHWSRSGVIDGRRLNGRTQAVAVLNVLSEPSSIAEESKGATELDDSTVGTGAIFSIWQHPHDPCSDCLSCGSAEEAPATEACSR